MGIKNAWSLNVDELLVADKLRHYIDKNKHEVFFPLNSQLKDVDLILINLKNNKALSVQVKGSRTYSPTKSETERYGEGSAAWFTLTKKSIFENSNKVDFFVFVLHSMRDGKTKKEIKINYLIIPSKDFKRLTSKKKIRKGEKYHFFMWIDPNGKRAFDFNDRSNIVRFSKYLDNWDLIVK